MHLYVKHDSSILSKTFGPLQSGYVREKDIHAFPSEPQNQRRFEELLNHLRMPLTTRAPECPASNAKLATSYARSRHKNVLI